MTYTPSWSVFCLPTRPTTPATECAGWPTFVRAKKDGGWSDMSKIVEVSLALKFSTTATRRVTQPRGCGVRDRDSTESYRSRRSGSAAPA
jgi:hypothetical protein